MSSSTARPSGSTRCRSTGPSSGPACAPRWPDPQRRELERPATQSASTTSSKAQCGTYVPSRWDGLQLDDVSVGVSDIGVRIVRTTLAPFEKAPSGSFDFLHRLIDGGLVNEPKTEMVNPAGGARLLRDFVQGDRVRS